MLLDLSADVKVSELVKKWYLPVNVFEWKFLEIYLLLYIITELEVHKWIIKDLDFCTNT